MLKNPYIFFLLFFLPLFAYSYLESYYSYLLIYWLLFCLFSYLLNFFRLPVLFCCFFLLLFNHNWIYSFVNRKDSLNYADKLEANGIVRLVKETKNKVELFMIRASLQQGAVEANYHDMKIKLLKNQYKKLFWFKVGDQLKITKLSCKPESKFLLDCFYNKRSRVVNLSSLNRRMNRSEFWIRLKFKSRYYLDGFSQFLFDSLLLADRSFMPKVWRLKSKKLGIYHLFAISGLHIGIIFLWVKFILKICFFRKTGFFYSGRGFKLFEFISLLFVYFYLIFIDFPLTAVRAFLMLLIWLILKYYLVYQTLLFILFQVAFIVIIENPASIGKVDFQLSFASLFAICMAIPILPETRSGFSFFTKLKNLILSASLISLWILLFTFPIISFNFNFISIAGILNNFVHINFLSFIILPFLILAVFILLINFLVFKIYLEFEIFSIFKTLACFWEKILLLNDSALGFLYFESDIKFTFAGICFYWFFLIIFSIFLKRLFK